MEIDWTVQDANRYRKTHYLKSIAEVILLCAQQDLALRGHHESMESSNRGNFLEILELVAGYDEVIKDKLKNGPRNAIYTSQTYKTL